MNRPRQSPHLDPIGRLAVRVEGDFWNAYYADQDTMDGALLLGSLHMRLAIIPERQAAFLALMQESVGDIIEEVVGTRPVWPKPAQAPAHERETQH